MKFLVALTICVVATQAKSVTDLQPLNIYVTTNPRHTAEEWDAIYAAAEANIPENTTGLVRRTSQQPEDAGKVFVRPAERIIGGAVASRGQFPWQALLVTESNSFSGASLISTQWVLTAAHCLDGYTTFQITLGSTSRSAAQSGVVTQVTRQAIIHSNYNPSTISNDISVLRLSSPVTLTNYINVIRLPRSDDATFAGSAAVVSGFGRINPSNSDVAENLLYANVDIITNTECARTFGSFIQAVHICSVGDNVRTICTGDSGGPLVVRESDGKYTQVGIVSFGISDCSPSSPAAYARVSKFLAWISSQTGVATL